MDRATCRWRDLRPIALMATPAKLIASLANLDIAAVAQHGVCGQLEGVLSSSSLTTSSSRRRGDRGVSLCVGSLPAAMPLDFERAFPSLMRRWM